MSEHNSIREYLNHLYLNEQVVFDETPNFEEISNKFSKQTMASDEALRTILSNVMSAKKKALTRAMEVLEERIDTRKINVVDVEADTETDPNHPIVSFSILSRDNGETISGFELQIGDNYIPTLNLDSRTVKNAVERSSAMYSVGLLAKLRLVETDDFSQIDDVSKAIKRRNGYLNSVYKKARGTISGLSFLEVSMLKQILKTDYKGIK